MYIGRMIQAIFIACLIPQFAVAEEQVLLFRSEIQIKPNRKIEVTETLQISVEGEKVKQGIIRALPLALEFPNLPTIPVSYQVTKVTRNGKNTPYTTATESNLLLLRIYERGVFLEYKEHTFKIHYTVSGYNFDSEVNDTFNWHVTGEGWPLPINLAEVFVKFPPLVLPENVLSSGYISTNGAQSSTNVVSRPTQKSVHYTTLEPLENGGGLVISAAWPKGFFNDNKLLAIPDERKRNSENEGLLSIPEEDDEGLQIPESDSFAITPTNFDANLFIPESIEQLFAEVRIATSGSVSINESITATVQTSQGLLRFISGTTDKITPEFAMVDQSALSIEKGGTTDRLFLVAAEPLSAGSHSFSFQYRLNPTIDSGQQFDRLKLNIGVPGLNRSVRSVGVRVYLPEYMLPNAELVNASVVSASGQEVEKVAASEAEGNLLIQPDASLDPGGKLSVELLIPKGFIHE